MKPVLVLEKDWDEVDMGWEVMNLLTRNNLHKERSELQQRLEVIGFDAYFVLRIILEYVEVGTERI